MTFDLMEGFENPCRRFDIKGHKALFCAQTHSSPIFTTQDSSITVTFELPGMNLSLQASLWMEGWTLPLMTSPMSSHDTFTGMHRFINERCLMVCKLDYEKWIFNWCFCSL